MHTKTLLALALACSAVHAHGPRRFQFHSMLTEQEKTRVGSPPPTQFFKQVRKRRGSFLGGLFSSFSVPR
jgi:hypothetical protein